MLRRSFIKLSGLLALTPNIVLSGAASEITSPVKTLKSSKSGLIRETYAFDITNDHYILRVDAGTKNQQWSASTVCDGSLKDRDQAREGVYSLIYDTLKKNKVRYSDLVKLANIS